MLNYLFHTSVSALLLAQVYQSFAYPVDSYPSLTLVKRQSGPPMPAPEIVPIIVTPGMREPPNSTAPPTGAPPSTASQVPLPASPAPSSMPVAPPVASASTSTSSSSRSPARFCTRDQRNICRGTDRYVACLAYLDAGGEPDPRDEVEQPVPPGTRCETNGNDAVFVTIA